MQRAPRSVYCGAAGWQCRRVARPRLICSDDNKLRKSQVTVTVPELPAPADLVIRKTIDRTSLPGR
eukprot:359560-Hanusia_phi.AAC.1